MSRFRRAVTGGFLAAADQIGRRVVQQAIWHEDRCNWVGAMPEERAPGYRTLTYRTLGPDLYGGTGGVAVFLALLYAATGDRLVRRTALGAIHHALLHVEDLPPTVAIGLYAGRFGVALAAAWVGALMDDAALLDQAARLLRDVVTLPADDRAFDLMAGRAGAVVGLLVLRELLNRPELLEPASHFGGELLELAVLGDECRSWKSPDFPASGNLTGFSHGAAGAGYALLELFNVTKDGAYRVAAEQAFNYERRLFNPEAQNWPDLRESAGRPRAGSTPTFATFWCHGAPGIALSRLRAHEIVCDETFRTEAVVAVSTTRNIVQMTLSVPSANYSLCHGLAGNSEVLLQARDVLGTAAGPGDRLPLAVAEAGIENYAHRGLPWPCGTYEGETSNLFLGLAGIGLYYLRLHDPAIPSLLLLRPESFRFAASG